MSGRLEAINVGQPTELVAGDRVVQSAIRKVPTLERCWLDEHGVTGDKQADLVNHAGPDKAVCVYPTEHHAHWAAALGQALGDAPFGENFSTTGLLESEVCIGDRFQIGSAVVEVSQPRIPCFKLGARHGRPEFPDWVIDSRLTGFYIRCVTPGWVQAGDDIALISRAESSMTIIEANDVLYDKSAPLDHVRRLLAIPALADSWHRILGKRLA